MEKYVFSGSMTQEMHDRLLACDDFEPLDILVSQVDRRGVEQAIQWKKDLVNYGTPDADGNFKQTYFCRWFFCDSGAYSVHTGKAHVTQDEYIDYINSIAEDIDVCAQMDTIPGRLNQPKTPEDYQHSAEKSWENFLYMRSKVSCPEKVMPVFHMGEDSSHLVRMLEYRDENGHQLSYIGLSPANDASVSERDIFLKDMYHIIQKSSNPKVKTHIYGFTTLHVMAKYPLYSADSITHRLLAAYGKIILPDVDDVVAVTSKNRRCRDKNSASFIEGCIQNRNVERLEALKRQAEEAHMTLDDLSESSNARTVFNIRSIQHLVKTKYAYKATNVARPKRFFDI